MKSKKAFTFIEIIITIVILGILMTVSYAPYNYYQNKAKLKVSTKDISQLLYESRNMAVNGSYSSAGNTSIGVYFNTSVSSKNQIKVFSYPHDIKVDDINNQELVDTKLIKTLVLRDGVQLDSVESGDNLLFFFEAITGNISYYNWSSLGIKSNITPDAGKDIIDINISYKGSSSPNLQSKLEYYTRTNIIDY